MSAYDGSGWVAPASLEAYRAVVSARRQQGQDEAYENMVNIMLGCFLFVPSLFILGPTICNQFEGKDSNALHDYVISHHQDADTVEEEAGNTRVLYNREEARKARGDPFSAEHMVDLGSNRASIFDSRDPNKNLGSQDDRSQSGSRSPLGEHDGGRVLEHIERRERVLEHVPGVVHHVKSAIERSFEEVGTALLALRMPAHCTAHSALSLLRLCRSTPTDPVTSTARRSASFWLRYE